MNDILIFEIAGVRYSHPVTMQKGPLDNNEIPVAQRNKFTSQRGCDPTIIVDLIRSRN
jgi:hypothetical protein